MRRVNYTAWENGVNIDVLFTSIFGTLSSDNLRDWDVTLDNFKRLLKTFLFSAYQCNYRIRCVTTMRSANLHFTYLLTLC